jgi:predicted Zn-dependent protease
MLTIDQINHTFQSVSDAILNELKENEALTIELAAEQSQFTRFNNAKIRQSGLVDDGYLGLRFISGNKTASRTVPFSGDLKADLERALEALKKLQLETPQLPDDPFIILPKDQGSSHARHEAQLLTETEIAAAILPPVKGLDFTGLYSAGDIIRANRNSAGQNHWFSARNFIVDYSLITPSEKMVKGTFAGRDWDEAAWKKNIENAKEQFQYLSLPPKTVPRGKYRTYLAPAAVADLINMLSWNGISENAMQQGNSALLKMRRDNKNWSHRFTLRENFTAGLVPRFNELGETAPEILELIAEGLLVNTLISSRSAKEYGKTANGASVEEGLRSPELLPGQLPQEKILEALDTGLYLSNLHYLNWSDNAGGRITGMTRYACFWVENGQIVAPIENMRWDETLYHIFGDKLMALTDFRELVPETSSYNMRSLGGTVVPGALVEDFSFTL